MSYQPGCLELALGGGTNCNSDPNLNTFISTSTSISTNIAILTLALKEAQLSLALNEARPFRSEVGSVQVFRPHRQ